MAEYIPERGYWIGPTLPIGEVPWPLFWEQQPNLDDCLHEWERVIIQRPHAYNGTEPVVRCRKCSAPRCGDSTDRDPCMERRHHRTTHLTLHGSFEPVGGYLRTSPGTRCCTSHHFEGCTDGGPGCCARCPINPTDDEGASA